MGQTVNDFELIIVNDKSPDDIDSIVLSFNDKRIRYTTNTENIGGKDLIKNWNLCCDMAKGEYLILASDDDIYSHIFLEEISDLLIKYPQVDLIRGRVRCTNDHGDEVEKDHFFPEYMTQDDFLYYASRGMISVQSQFVYKRKAFFKMGGFVNFPSAWNSDAATSYIMSCNGVCSTPSVVFSFRKSDIHITGDNSIYNKIVKLKANLIYWEWIDNFVKQLKIHNYKTIFFENTSHQKLLVQFDILLSSIPIYKLSVWNEYCFKNKFLQKTNKLKILFHAVFHQITHL